jgi:hypothetical protein
VKRKRPEQLWAELPPELAGHPDDSAVYEDWKAWRQRRREWLTEHGLPYEFIEDLRLRRLVRQSGGTWTQAEPGLSVWAPRGGWPER